LLNFAGLWHALNFFSGCVYDCRRGRAPLARPRPSNEKEDHRNEKTPWHKKKIPAIAMGSAYHWFLGQKENRQAAGIFRQVFKQIGITATQKTLDTFFFRPPGPPPDPYKPQAFY
jgi:hypothetical protein